MTAILKLVKAILKLVKYLPCAWNLGLPETTIHIHVDYSSQTKVNLDFIISTSLYFLSVLSKDEPAFHY